MAQSRNLVLLSPGPTIVPEDIKKLFARSDMHHRVDPFPAYWESIREKIQSFFEIDEPRVFIRSSSGTLMMQIIAENVVAPGDRVLQLDHGYFSARWKKMLEGFGGLVDEMLVPWGSAIEPRVLEEKLKVAPRNHYKAVFLQATDTATGVLNPLEAIAKTVKRHSNALIVVDAVFEAGVSPIKMGDWGIDAVVCACQKAFMLPPGMAFLVLSPEAYERIGERGLPVSFYGDIVAECAKNENGDTMVTPPIQHMACLDYVLGKYLREGLPRVYGRNRRMAHFVRDEISALGLPLYPQENASNGITVVWMPSPAISTADIVARLERKHHIIIANGQKHLKDKVFRFAHFGAVDVEEHLVPFLRVLGRTLTELGWVPPAPASK